MAAYRDYDDREFLFDSLVRLAHLLVEADVAVARRTERAPMAVNSLGPKFFLAQVMEMVRSLARPSRWRLELEKSERDDLDASSSIAVAHLDHVVHEGKPFEMEPMLALLKALGNLLNPLYSFTGVDEWGYGPVGAGVYPVGPAGGGVVAGPGRDAAPAPSAPPAEQALSAAPPAPVVEQITDTVRLGMSAPQCVRTGEEFTARFVAYLPVLEQQVREILTNLSPRSTSHLGAKFSHHWVRGTKITVRLRGEYLVCEKPQQEFVWNGNMSLVDFDLQIQPKHPRGIHNSQIRRFHRAC